MASGRVERIEDDEDDVYDDGRFYEYKPKRISLDEILSGSEKNVDVAGPLNNESAVYLDQNFEYEVNSIDLNLYITRMKHGKFESICN